MNGTLGFRGLIDDNKIVNAPGNIEALNIRGNSERYELTYRQPFIRTPQEELALSLGFGYYQGQTFLFNDIATPFGFGPDEQGFSRTSVFTIGVDYTYRQPEGAWALRSQFRIGTCILAATCNPDPLPSAEFFSWLAQAQRVQILNEDNLLIIQAELQLTPDPLLASEQFVIGGAASVRGYRQNILAGDNGFRFSIEDRITLVRSETGDSVFTLAPFFDMGSVWNAANNPNTILADRTFIAGLGMGFIWQPLQGLNLRLDYAPPLVNLNTRGKNIQDYGLYFSVGYDF
jgi:hemolysin activation/secretion protein